MTNILPRYDPKLILQLFRLEACNCIFLLQIVNQSLLMKVLNSAPLLCCLQTTLHTKLINSCKCRRQFQWCQFLDFKEEVLQLCVSESTLNAIQCSIMDFLNMLLFESLS